ncbi:MAG: serine/threonine protein phosphatase PrpC [Kiritimatiellia bacterium]|jgi:serine/threonine protein phosphatase PrpC
MNKSQVFNNIQYASRSDVGLRRQKNEDSMLNLPECGLFLVADGMGGAGGGDIASKAVVDHVQRAFTGIDPLAGLQLKIEAMRTACNDASRWIRLKSEELETRGMGTTVVTLLLDAMDPRRAAILHAGDSRVYVKRSNMLIKLMVDHSPAAEAGLDDESLVPFFLQGIITRAVGVSDVVALECTYIELEAADLLLICSDGFYNMLSDAEMLARLQGSMDHLGDLARRAVDAANRAGGLDNISITLLRVDPTT